MHRRAGPDPVEIGQDPALVQFSCNYAFRTSVFQETAVDPADGFHLGLGPGHKDHPISLQAFVFATFQFGLHLAPFVKQDTAKAKTRWAALSIAEFDQAALPSEDLVGQLATVLACHGALDALDDGRNRAAVIFELLGAIFDLLVRATADVFVIGGFICILEPAPPADVIDEDHLKIGGAVLHILDQLLQGLAALDPEAAFPGIGIGAHQFETAFGGIFADRV
ncbi:hypothetical protein GALL_433660 [mine drainage metagenome]|uniref:Uncharacterized protein n=1 Tax=mine drainage metagenome TaxID=410659 RepID=A0A1J5Q4R5_9ZZZZ